jgi:2-amino-4-hydroxy-6-hydroxymethyldihydropteridine diphosphokinase
MKIIALGSNLPSSFGTPRDNVIQAVEILTANGFNITARAALYETAPVPVSDQPWFVNTVISVNFIGAAESALAACLAAENQMGRIRTVANAARVIDIDLIIWDDVVQGHVPHLPHPRLHERAFVLFPLCDLLPDWQHPHLQQTAKALRDHLPPGGIRKAQEQW